MTAGTKGAFNRSRHYFEDFAVGDAVLSSGRTVDIGDITSFAGLTGDHYPLHVDEEYGRATRFGGRIAHGPLTFALAVGRIALSGFLGDAIVALLECQNLRALAPVRPGDTIRVRAEVAAAEPGSKPAYGTLRLDYTVTNQRDQEVMRFRTVLLARRRPQDAPGGPGAPGSHRASTEGAR
ncbi:MaoC family dehydratase [Streptomyces acidicola]|uniref:Dehydratase n=1 Tax=Streptomyces acidicola TaxID=2596892 RepID=A0A5N8WKX9_9ACTN|nr:MaoC/PaaZ C-terminal domain-containing protein [Streptomyces acidicola]MPY47486.1 dehydratase [Streptomyces acidicola]